MPRTLQAIDDGALPVIEPTWRLAWPETDGARSVAISPDDRFAYVHIVEDAVDVWALLVMHWRISAGVVLGLIALVALLWVVRVIRRPRRAGVAYCAKCNYDLLALGGAAACPECGLSIAAKKSHLGRARWRRLAVPVMVIAAAGAGYGSLLLVSAEGWAAVSGAAFWPSTRLVGWSEGWATPWVGQAMTKMDRIVEVDLTTGRKVRTVMVGPESYSYICLSPDGASLYRTDSTHSNRLTRIDIRTGRRIAFAEFPGRVAGADLPSAIGFSSDGGAVYVQWKRVGIGTYGVSAWRLADGEVSTLVTTTPHQRWEAGWSYSGHFFPLTEGDRTSFVSVPQLRQPRSEGTTVALWHQESAAPTEVLLKDENRSIVTAVSQASGSLFIFSQTQEIVEFDLRTGKELGRLRAPVQKNVGLTAELVLSADERRMFVQADMSCVLIGDLKEREWMARLIIPEGLYVPILSDSPTGRWVAAVLGKSRGPATGTGNKWTYELVIWDVGGVVK